MIQMHKNVGETPLQALKRLQKDKSELSGEKLSYAGRLDPMAEGVMLVLVGDENKTYKKHLNYDKEYVATFLLGMNTDTGDALGMISRKSSQELSDAEIKSSVDSFVEIESQVYPWFSSKTVGGVKLFDHYKNGNLSIKRPEREVKIYDAECHKIYTQSVDEVNSYIKEKIALIEGDFRQEEILKNWQEYFDENAGKEMKLVEVKLKVSTGTYIRTIAEEFGVPAILLKLNRTKVFV